MRGTDVRISHPERREMTLNSGIGFVPYRNTETEVLLIEIVIHRKGIYMS